MIVCKYDFRYHNRNSITPIHYEHFMVISKDNIYINKVAFGPHRYLYPLLPGL
jgi:hypothetical protein